MNFSKKKQILIWAGIALIVFGAVGVLLGLIFYNLGKSPHFMGGIVAGSLLIIVLGLTAFMVGEDLFLE